MTLRLQLGKLVKKSTVQATGPLTMFLRQATAELPALLIQVYQSFSG